MSINSSMQQISVGLASVIAGLVVIKTPTNALAHYEITGYISIAVTLVSIFVISKLNAKVSSKWILGSKEVA